MKTITAITTLVALWRWQPPLADNNAVPEDGASTTFLCRRQSLFHRHPPPSVVLIRSQVSFSIRDEAMTGRNGQMKTSGMPGGGVYRWQSSRNGRLQRQTLPAAKCNGRQTPLCKSNIDQLFS
ncbi:hypothetical protein LXL04_008455 [Taraxacum kok-saghyz]